ncbi:PD-(D/E)XK nuclease family protein [Salinadaptatus halalkaliphilus]|uniref:PD-(D/E)XK nuclease family protein n=1 Tax=Salinadaptatus halalkaliphilus TaxID=2419781 RepID=A0A4S3TJI3_9EURY|nr:PD-(D/E)XK nuclease family protein [Salinadaptatus halalkaliphilus]THE64259.1 PD-(D/E)XK nuclease family protein [Salinadaptatus halalkaliphilus]
MDPTLLTGPQHARLEQRAFQRADDLAADSLGSILYITRNDARRSEIEDRWASFHRPLRLRSETLDSVVRNWYENLYDPVETLSGQLNRRLTEYALDETTAETAGALAGEPASAALADSFSSRFSLFDEAGVRTADTLETEFENSSLDDRIATATVDAYHYYRELYADHVEDWVNTRGELFHGVATADQSLSTLSPEIDVVILSGYYEFRPVERYIIERIVEEFPTIALLPLHQDGRTGVDVVASDALDVYESLDFETVSLEPKDESGRAFGAVTNALYRPDPETTAVPDGLNWRELPTPEREIRFVARELRTELANGRDPDDFAVVIPGTNAYSSTVEDTFETFDIPHVTTAASQLTRTFTGSVVHDLLSLAEADPRAEDLTSLLANPLVDIVDNEQASTITATARRRDTISAAPLLEATNAETNALLEDLLASLETLRTGDIEEATETFRRLLDDQFDLEAAVGDYASGAEQALEHRAYEVVDEVLTSFETLEKVSTDQSPLALFTRAFDGIPIQTSQTAAGGHVEVMGLLDARMRSFEKVFLVGLTSEHFPATPERPAFFEAMTEAHPRFDTADERLRGRYLFATLLANVDALTITTPETGGDESAVVRSPVLDELQRVTGIEPKTGVDDRIGSREDLQRHVATASDRRVAVSHAGDRGDLSPEQTKRTDRGLQCADNRATATLSEHDGLLDPETVDAVYPPSEREPYSASRIEQYVECGFKFYADNVLEIEDPDDVEVVPTALETGSYVHDVLERFYADLQDDSKASVDLTDYDRDTLADHLHTVAVEELREADFEYDGLFYERWKAELFAGLRDEDSVPFEAGVQPHDAPEQGLFATFLDNELSKAGAAAPYLFEPPFGEGLPESDSEPFSVERPDGSTVAIRGYIDRIDVNRDAEQPEITLYDYKTGYAPYMTKTTGGTTFQLPIYLLAANEVIDGDLFDQGTLSATYYQVRPPNDLKVPRGVESKFDSQTELRRFLEDVVPEWLGQIDDAIANGRFHTTLHSPRGANCRFCDYRRACDVRHHRKREFIDTAREDEVAYVPLRVRDDEDLQTVMSDD